MGIFSFARYDDNFYTRHYAGRLKKHLEPRQGDYSVFDGYYTPPITSTLLLRSCKVTEKPLSALHLFLNFTFVSVFSFHYNVSLQTMTHEIGHMFGIRHCQWLSCVMQGSNHLEESDRRPLDLCPICLHKLHTSVGFNIAQRYKVMKHFHWKQEDNCNINPVLY